MTNFIVIQFLFILMGVISIGDPPADIKDYGKWQEARNSNGVKSYVRWLMRDEKITYRERRGEMDIRCTHQEAVKVLSNPQYTPEWMAGIEESRFLGNPGKNEWYTYTVFSMPWPFNKRDLVSLNKVASDPIKGIAHIEMNCKEDYLPLQKDILRLTDYKAHWKIVKINENNIHITFIAESSTPPAFPRYIQDPVIEKLFHNNLVRLKKLLEEN